MTEEEMEREIHMRIRYEKAVRTKQHVDELIKLQKDRAAEMERLGHDPGVKYVYEVKESDLLLEQEIRNKEDDERHNAYWDSYHNGTYEPLKANPEKEAKIEEGLDHMNTLIRVYKDKVPKYELERFEQEFGKGLVKDMIMHNLKRDVKAERERERKAAEAEAEKQKAEQARLEKEKIETIKRNQQARKQREEAEKLQKKQDDLLRMIQEARERETNRSRTPSP